MTYYSNIDGKVFMSDTLKGIIGKAVTALRRKKPTENIPDWWSHHVMIFYNDRTFSKEECFIGTVDRGVFKHIDGTVEERLNYVSWGWKNGKRVNIRTYNVSADGRCLGEAKW